MPAKQFVIYGAGSLGREVLNYSGHRNLLTAPRGELMWLDDGRNEGEVIDGVQVGRLADIEADASIVVALADPVVRAKVSFRLLQAGVPIKALRFGPSIGSWVTGARDSIIFPFTLISCNVSVARGLFMNVYASIGHDCVIGRYCTLGPYVGLLGKCRVGHHVFIGAGAKVIPGINIGDNAHIGAGSVVLRDVAPGECVFGNPSRKVG